MVEEPGLNPGRPLWASGVRTAPLPRCIPVDVAQWTEHRSTKPGVPGSTPGVDASELHLPPERHVHLAVAQLDRAPLSEGGGRTFESCRRGQCPCSSTVEHAPGTGEVWVRPPARALHHITQVPREVAG